jgi:hypothetical protein
MKTLIAMLGLVVLASMAPGPAWAQAYPNVANLKPYSEQTSNMSLAGYLRYIYHEMSGQWLSWQDAERIVAQQLSGS